MLRIDGQRSGPTLVLLLTLLAGLGNAQAAIYRWVSPDGVVSYGGNPPANARNVETLDGLPAVTSAAPATPAPKPAAPVTESVAPSQSPAAGNNDRKALQAELAAARLQLAQATAAYEQGKAVRLGNERNYAHYLQRIDQLKEAVHIAQLRVLILEHQLAQ
ncbi:MAG: DUF4124 domain-containing protein [Acidithiobacillus sp.]|nr:DUF4124 domain-containing protein [Acidithiobacillus sp.]